MKSVTRIFLPVLLVFFSSQIAYTEIKESSTIIVTSAVIAAASTANCPNEEGTWISTNRYPHDYETFITLNGSGDVTEVGAFNYANYDSPPYPYPGSYQILGGNCRIEGSVASKKGETTFFSGRIVSSTEMELSGNDLDMNFIKVSDTGACQGAWSGTLAAINPPQPPSPTIQFQVGSDGSISSFTGLAPPVSGKMYCESGRGVAQMDTGETSDLNSIVLDGTLSGNTMTGRYGTDSSNQDDPDGTFTISRQ